jgi:methylcytosine dioxygenase TET2/3
VLNHQQHHTHYAATTSHVDHLNNKQMTATLTATPTSGNEMPGYPRVLSEPPRSLNCNGYPGLGEYGGNSINTTANNQSTTSTSSSQMQPPSTTQSPSRQQPSRPNSSSNHMSYQQQSPNHFNSSNSNNNSVHMSPTQAQSPSASTTPINNNQQHYPTSGMITPTSHHQQSIHDGAQQQQDWNQNAWNGNPQNNEIFNQSDRINLNTRLKTMILNKNDKEQQQQQSQSTGHFLSYSHQHLSTEQNQQQQQLSDNNPSNTNSLTLSSNSNTNNNNNECIKEAGKGDDGGFKINDSWKSSIIKQEQQDQQNRGKDFFEQKQQLNAKNNGIDPGGGGGGGHRKDDSPKNNNTNSNSSKDEGYSGSSTNSENNQHQTYPSSEFNSVASKLEKNNSLDDKPSYAYNSAHEYQQHQTMVSSIKKEPNIEMEGTTASIPSSIKFEGYEKNYQNFIRYADFCDTASTQQPGVPTSVNSQYQEHQHQKQSQYHQQDYIQSQGGYYNYPYQNYPQNYHSQNYQPPFMTSSQQAAYQQHHHHHHHSSLTNFEQQIPLHTYPIPKPTGTGAKMHGSDLPIKNEPSLHPYPFLSENMNASNVAAAAVSKDNIGNYSRPINPINEVPSIENTLSTKEQVSLKFFFSLLFTILKLFMINF